MLPLVLQLWLLGRGKVDNWLSEVLHNELVTLICCLERCHKWTNYMQSSDHGEGKRQCAAGP